MSRRPTTPVLTWVGELPPAWANEAERLVLYVLALDAPDGVASMGQLVLAQRTGLSVPQLRITLHQLCVPTSLRPPLLERLPRKDRRGADRYRLAPGNDRTSSERLLPLLTTSEQAT